MIKPGTILPCDTPSDSGHNVVAVIGYVHDFSAYEWHNTASDEDCANHGDKISENQARRLFPELEILSYRY